MPIPADFLPLRLCEPCKRLFTDYKGESGYESIQFQMWYEEKGYRYTRSQRDLECSAAFKCVFCKAVASRDAKYGQGSQPMDEVCFNEPRPNWYPSLDEELELTIRYNWVDNSGSSSPSCFGHRRLILYQFRTRQCPLVYSKGSLPHYPARS